MSGLFGISYPLGLVLWLIVLEPNQCGSVGDQCPSPCTCKWKGGKQTVECVERGLIMIPESINAETQVLDLSGNNLQILPRETFVRSGLLNLQRAFFKNCRIGQIDDLAFKGLTNLIELDLSFNLLTSIPSGTFRDVPSLRDLILSNNPIQKIDSHAFRSIPGLVKLDLSDCDIQTIAPKAFEGIELLESLKLNGNRLSELRLQTVEILQRLHGVELHDNPWYCDCRLRAVKEWLINNNIPYPEPPVCSGGPERIIHKTFAELHIDDFTCKPEILPVRRHIEASTGENATILCRANAVPAAQINWYWNGRLLLNNSAFSSYQKIFVFEEGKHEKRSSLVLTNAREVDSNEFYCVAENRAGNAEANFTLHVSMRSVGLTSLGSGQLLGLSAILIILILFVLLVISVLLVRFRRIPFTETKTPNQMEVVTVVNGAVPNGKQISPRQSPDEPRIAENQPSNDNNQFCNPVQKPPRLGDVPYYTAHFNPNTAPGAAFISPSASVNNPDLINDTKVQGSNEMCVTGSEHFLFDNIERPGSGEYSRNIDSLYPSSLWDNSEPEMNFRETSLANSNPLSYDDKTPIMGDGTSTGGSAEELRYRMAAGTNRVVGYPMDYGLPIVDNNLTSPQTSHPVNAKTLRVWQKGAVPVLPPVTALKRALSSNRNSPDEGYQEGCGTDV